MPRRPQKGTTVILSDTGTSRVNGYLFVLERSLGTFLPRESVRDVVREIDSHLRDRISAAQAVPDERAMLERILGELGPPQRVAQAYSVERTVDEAVVTGKLLAIVRAIWYVATSGVSGFFGGLGLFVGYVVGASFIVLAAMKPIFPDHVGIWVGSRSIADGLDIGWRAGVHVATSSQEHLVGGYWVIPGFLVAGPGLLLLTHRGARKFLGWWRRRRPGFTVTVRPAT
jgi:uncharacterized membrane protein